jgi:hypothetical protein
VLPPSLISACAESYTIESNEHAPHCSQTTYGYGQVSSTFRGEQVVYHTGGFPGQTTYIGRIPERDIGIAILTNTYFSGRNVFTIGSYRILEDLLNVTDPYDYEAWRFELIFPKVNSTRLRPAHPAPAPEGVDVEGTYVHPGYGKMELRRFDSDAHTPIGEAITAELKLRTIDTTTTPTFIANFSRTFVSHFAFTHFSGSIYNATSFQYYEDVLTGEPINDFSDLGTAVFTEGGFGLWDLNQADPKFHRPLSEDKVQENADIWFERR